jgi:integrase
MHHLIAARLGLRASDIARLEFSCLIWEKSCISLIQYKTKEPLVLPLTNEIGSALIDYLKYSRPKSILPGSFSN